jgi:hypothetical protein
MGIFDAPRASEVFASGAFFIAIFEQTEHLRSKTAPEGRHSIAMKVQRLSHQEIIEQWTE